jgi:hypothetical protein
MPRARVDDDEGPAAGIDGDALRRNDTNEPIVDRTFQRSAIDYDFRLVAQYMRRGFGQMLAISVPALSHDVPEQDRALGGVDRVVHRRAEEAKHVG